jgi:hypothetical protein
LCHGPCRFGLRGSGTSLRLFQGGAQRGDVVMGGIHGDYFTPKT